MTSIKEDIKTQIEFLYRSSLDMAGCYRFYDGEYSPPNFDQRNQIIAYFELMFNCDYISCEEYDPAWVKELVEDRVLQHKEQNKSAYFAVWEDIKVCELINLKNNGE